MISLQDRIQQAQWALDAAIRRRIQLEEKCTRMSQAEIYELDMLNADIDRLRALLGKTTQPDSPAEGK